MIPLHSSPKERNLSSNHIYRMRKCHVCRTRFENVKSYYGHLSQCPICQKKMCLPGHLQEDHGDIIMHDASDCLIIISDICTRCKAPCHDDIFCDMKLCSSCVDVICCGLCERYKLCNICEGHVIDIFRCLPIVSPSEYCNAFSKKEYTCEGWSGCYCDDDEGLDLVFSYEKTRGMCSDCLIVHHCSCCRECRDVEMQKES